MGKCKYTPLSRSPPSNRAVEWIIPAVQPSAKREIGLASRDRAAGRWNLEAFNLIIFELTTNACSDAIQAIEFGSVRGERSNQLFRWYKRSSSYGRIGYIDRKPNTRLKWIKSFNYWNERLIDQRNGMDTCSPSLREKIAISLFGNQRLSFRNILLVYSMLMLTI